jgi:hypothetical protein
VLFFFNVMPLVEIGIVNLMPDPCNFDPHLRTQMLRMAEARSAGLTMDKRTEPRFERLMEEDFRRGLMSLPRDALRSQLVRASSELNEARADEVLRHIDHLKENDPLAVLQEDSFGDGEKRGQFNMMKLAPNFEMTLYIAQATGSCIVTDSPFRWTEIKRAMLQRAQLPHSAFASLARGIEARQFAFAQNVLDIAKLYFDKALAAYPPLFRDVYKYLSNLGERGPKPNREAQLIGRLTKGHGPAQAAVKKARVRNKQGRISCAIPEGGIQDNTVNRLLLMSSSEQHLPNVPMAFFVEELRR